jgi:ketosteroid isomerase-like protein
VDSTRVALVREVYDRFNDADIPGVLDFLDTDVEMPDVLHGTTLRGTEALREYWEEQFRLVDHSIMASEIVEVGDAVMVVAFHEVYERQGGQPLGRGVAAVHRLTFRGDRIAAIEYTGVDEVPEQVQRRLT